jgi:probable rRNA maturation factor
VRVSVRARSPVSGAEAARLARAVLRAEGVGGALLSIALVGRRRIRSLNRRHLGHDRETDVIAFTLGTEPRGPARSRTVVGDVYVCVPVAADQAPRYGATPKAELRRLVVHGVLHVLGYRHPSGAGRATSPMWRRQERLLARLVPGR